MLIKPICENYFDANGMPEGGAAFGPGFAISWQRGPLGTGVDRKDPNGAFVDHDAADGRDFAERERDLQRLRRRGIAEEVVEAIGDAVGQAFWSEVRLG